MFSIQIRVFRIARKVLSNHNYLLVFCLPSGTTTLLSTYRNKPAVTDYTLGAALAGSIYKFSLGPKGMISGGIFGGILGTVGGAIIVPMLKLSGQPMSDMYATTHAYFKMKDTNLHQASRVSFTFFCFFFFKSLHKLDVWQILDSKVFVYSFHFSAIMTENLSHFSILFRRRAQTTMYYFLLKSRQLNVQWVIDSMNLKI